MMEFLLDLVQALSLPDIGYEINQSIFGAIAGIASVGSSLISAFSGRSDSRDAASAQIASSREAIEENRRQFDQTRADFAPFRQAGSEAVDLIREILINPGRLSEFVEQDPSIDFIRREGDRALQFGQAARNDLDSTRAGRELIRFGQDRGSTFVDQAIRRLFGLSEIGSGATATTVAANQQSTGNISRLLGESGLARAGGIVSGGNAFRSGISDAVNNAISLFGTQQGRSALAGAPNVSDSIVFPGGGFGGGGGTFRTDDPLPAFLL